MAQHKNKKRREKKKLKREIAQNRRDSEKPIDEAAPEVTNVFHVPIPHSDIVFVGLPRVSSIKQLHNYSLAQQYWTIRKYALEKHLKLLSDYRIQCSSLWPKDKKEFLQQNFIKYPKSCLNPKTYKPHYDNLKDIVYSLYLLQQQNPTVKYALLFTSVDRALRADDYDALHNKDAKLISEELLMYLSVTCPFESYVICDPLMKADEIQEWQKDYGVVIKSEQPRQVGDLKREYDEFNGKIIRRCNHYLKFKKDLSKEKIYDEIHKEYPNIKRSRIKYWYCNK